MPLFLAGLAGFGIGLFSGGQVDDAVEGAPSPLSVVGLAVWGLAAFGAWQIIRRVT